MPEKSQSLHRVWELPFSGWGSAYSSKVTDTLSYLQERARERAQKLHSFGAFL